MNQLNTLQIGKAGITDTTVAKAKEMLKKHKIIKVKMLPTAVKGDKNKVIKELAEKTNSRIKQRVGFTAVFEKKNTASNK